MKLLAVLLAVGCSGAEVRVQVLSLFRLSAFGVKAASMQLGGQALGSQLTVSAKGRMVCAGNVCGEALRTFGGSVELSVPGKISRSYPGDVRITARDGELVAVIGLDLENAVAAVVAAEMPSAPVEAQLAQAVAARSFYAAQARRHGDADFCDSTHCQFLTVSTEASRDAALRTRGRVLRFRGKPVPAMYFRSCGGRTMRAEDVRLPGGEYPFQAVECAVCGRDPYRWVSELPEGAVPESRSEAERLELTRRLGWGRLPSNDYVVERREGKGAVLRGKGEGHGVGMCQRGAVGMAVSGADFMGILRHYFPGASLGE